MTWKLFEQLFPYGVITGLGEQTAKNLRKNPTIKVINVPENQFAREMLILKKNYIIGENDEFAVGTDYNVYDETSHPDKTCCPLSVYGQAMLNNYLYFHPEINI